MINRKDLNLTSKIENYCVITIINSNDKFQSDVNIIYIA